MTFDPSIPVRRAYEVYSGLPSSSKPRIRENGKKEWTVLASIFLYKVGRESDVECISIGTGLKALPSTLICPQGDNLHDMHAEILARRGFDRWLLVQLTGMMDDSQSTDHPWIQICRDDERTFQLRSDVRVGLFSTMLPCGDASMSLLTEEDEVKLKEGETQSKNIPSTISTITSDLWGWSDSDLSSSLLRGRIGYSSIHRGKLRTKPGRLDSLPSYSMSCSDKILGWSIYGVQSKYLSEFIRPVFLDVMVFEVNLNVDGDKGEKEQRIEVLKDEVLQSLWGRGKDWNRQQDLQEFQEYGFTSTSPLSTTRQPSIFLVEPSFAYRKLSDPSITVSCNDSIVWIQGEGHEVLIQGVKRGHAPIKPQINQTSNSSDVSTSTSTTSIKGTPGFKKPSYKGRSRVCKSCLKESSDELRRLVQKQLTMKKKKKQQHGNECGELQSDDLGQQKVKDQGGGGQKEENVDKQGEGLGLESQSAELLERYWQVKRTVRGERGVLRGWIVGHFRI